MRRGAVIAEIAAWTLFFPIAIVLMFRRLLGYGQQTPEGRVDALLRWYPARWRERHGAGYHARSASTRPSAVSYP